MTFAPGDPYTAEALQIFLRRLNGSGYFASAQATVEADPAQADAAPVHLRLIEAPRKKDQRRRRLLHRHAVPRTGDLR